MTLSQWALLGFGVWTLTLVLVGIGVPRISAILASKQPPTAFRADVPHGSERYQRTMRAHLNCVENLPIFASLVLLASVTRLSSGTFEALALLVLLARVPQSLIHVASGRSRAVVIRFVFYAVQFLSMCGMALILALMA